MQEEQFDIVDNQNKPIGQIASRSEAHDKGLWHRTVHVYFYRVKNGNIELLAHLRSRDKDANPHKWDTRFGGHIKAGQTAEEAAVSETQEEVGIAIKEEDLLDGGWWSKNEEGRHFSRNFFYQFNGDIDDLHFDDGEVEQVKWMTAPHIEKEIFNNSDKWTGKIAGFQKVVEFLTHHRGG